MFSYATHRSWMTCMLWSSILLLITTMVINTVPTQGAPPTANTNVPKPKKIIEWGWDQPTPEYVRDNIRTMEEQPFNGIVLRPGDRFILGFDNTLWTEEDLQIDALSEIEWESFTDNFISLSMISKNNDPDWYDDSLWETIDANIRLMSQAIAACRCEGLVFDPEFYFRNETYSPWIYEQSLYPGQSFENVEQKVRQRGSQFMTSLQSEVDHLTIISVWMTGIVRAQAEADNGDRSTGEYALLPAFVNGMLDVAHPESVIVDGNEGTYYHDATTKFYQGYEYLYDAFDYLAPEHQDKVGTQLQIAAALYADLVLDGVLDDRTIPDSLRQDWWKHNTYHGLAVSDEYLWVYSEGMDLWPGDEYPGTNYSEEDFTDAPPFEGMLDGLRNGYDLYQAGESLGYDMYKQDYGDPDEIPTIITSPDATITSPQNGTQVDSGETVNVTVTTTSDNINEVQLLLNSREVATSTDAPFEFALADLADGNYVLIARVFDDESRHGTSASVNLVVGSDAASQPVYLPLIQNVALVDAATGQSIPGFTSLDGSVDLSLRDLPEQLSLQATTDTRHSGSVQFVQNGQIIQTENHQPYCTKVDRPVNDGRSCNAVQWLTTPGEYEVTITPFTKKDAQGKEGEPYTLSLNVTS
ncbi:MAG: hypothetical protein GFH27_549281n9 [Chloroflexi bacterium AL-W]|nr:hypothetical protein [Chloroflexi bacterium AL-N1]NOK65895.1 hypothetical protein [Chloroflexi bacterium AL-N10]NOK72776.1 hypothetical protein [Chloroflexi bacterium AL-N5]NOK79673.1 hypothetical protein [Chloroflexi bacterium AL-W]NOK92998.1 hypothetical protein [Chloroflexi bacterium AL-N15]